MRRQRGQGGSRYSVSAAVAGFATGLGLLTAACSGDQGLPAGLNHRFVAGGNFSIAVPAGWGDVSAPATPGFPGGHAVFAVGIPGTPSQRVTVTVLSGTDSLGLDQAGDPVPLTIAGQHVTGITDNQRLGVTAVFTHARYTYDVECGVAVPRTTCTAILNSWRWGGG